MDFTDRSCSAPVLSEGKVTETQEELEYTFNSDGTSERDEESVVDGFFSHSPKLNHSPKWWTKIGVACDRVADICGDTDGSKEKTLAETLQAVSLAANAIETRSVQVSHLCTELNQLTKSTQDVLHSRVIQNLFGTIAFVLSAVGFALFELIIPSETSFFFKFPIQIMLLVLIVHFFLLIVK